MYTYVLFVFVHRKTHRNLHIYIRKHFIFNNKQNRKKTGKKKSNENRHRIEKELKIRKIIGKHGKKGKLDMKSVKNEIQRKNS